MQDAELKEILAQNVRRIRGELGLSRAELAKEAGIAEITLHRIESEPNNHNIRLTTVTSVAKALKCNPAELMQVYDENINNIVDTLYKDIETALDNLKAVKRSLNRN